MLWKIFKAMIRFVFAVAGFAFVLVVAMTIGMALPLIGILLLVVFPIIVIIRMFGLK